MSIIRRRVYVTAVLRFLETNKENGATKRESQSALGYAVLHRAQAADWRTQIRVQVLAG